MERRGKRNVKRPEWAKGCEKRWDKIVSEGDAILHITRTPNSENYTNCLGSNFYPRKYRTQPNGKGFCLAGQIAHHFS